MKIYIALIDDRHCDPEPYPFTTAEAAIAYARSQAVDGAADGQIEEEEINGCLYHASYSVEGDSVWVIERDLDATP